MADEEHGAERTKTDDGRGSRNGISRRQLIAGGGAAAVTGVVGVGIGFALDDDEAEPKEQAAAPDARALKALTAGEAATLAAILARLIPSDESGPGAQEAMVWRYVDRALAGDLSDVRPLYVDGLEAVDRYARRTAGGPFAELEPAAQDEILTAMESGKAKGFRGDPQAFFTTLHAHAMQGMFGDPAHGGNAGFAGWQLLGYPGVKAVWTASEQELDADVDDESQSAYALGFFGMPETGGQDRG